ncbi:cytochrome P450 6g1-like [Phlebotomus argentipes]|uniref:cytochrome P450 6g1-like n=1 Tax=Phlebotomus argentipes TaxID=94469 RepID=UPI00289329D3|nr:cytochrome P450 6g1-like [Phlebotomus argentipes]XP_059610651.1 cytochrome P450 6g1-like [Phlebotomus argentipes]XP_059610652.1 cytochrome P450 6g1-like [Phlebotomus argentipes]
MSAFEVILWTSIVLLYLWKGLKQYLQYFWLSKRVSYIAGPPMIGALKDVLLNRTSFPQMFVDLYNEPKTRNDAVSGFYFFHKPCLLIRDPELIKRILVKDFSQFPDRRMASDPKSDPIGAYNLLAAKGDTWKSIRSNLTPIFTVHKVKNFIKLISDVCEDLKDKLAKDIPSKGSAELNIKEVAGLYTIETIASCSFGVKTNSFNNPDCDFRRNVHEIISPSKLKQKFQFAGCFFFPEFASMLQLKFISKEGRQFLKASVLGVMEEREKSGLKRNDLIDAMIVMKNTQKDIFHTDALLAQAAVFLVAGYDTSASVLSFALYELARHQDKQEKLRKELMDFAGSEKEIPYENLNNLKYLDMVFQEILRLYPSLSFLERICQPSAGAKTYSLAPVHDFAVPKGMPVYIPVISVQRDPKFFPDPLSFRPERFAANADPPIDQRLLLGFGQGPRNCLGLRLGALQVKMALITILLKYRLSFCKKTPEEVVFTKKAVLTLSEKPLIVTFTEI